MKTVLDYAGTKTFVPIKRHEGLEALTNFLRAIAVILTIILSYVLTHHV